MVALLAFANQGRRVLVRGDVPNNEFDERLAVNVDQAATDFDIDAGSIGRMKTGLMLGPDKAGEVAYIAVARCQAKQGLYALRAV